MNLTKLNHRKIATVLFDEFHSESWTASRQKAVEMQTDRPENSSYKTAADALSVTKGRSTRPDIKLGICGEHGGDPDSVKFCHKLGLTYVSCSPFRVPVARLAAAQAAIADAKK